MSQKHKHKGRVYGVTSESKPIKEWGQDQRGEEEVTCSLVGEPKVLLNLTSKYKIHFLMDEYPGREWLGYLVGSITAEGHFIIEDLTIPPHKESTYSSAEAEPFNIPGDCVGFIHSHHRMGAFHSSTDQTHVDRNYPLSITVAKGTDGKIEYDAVSHTQTPCGKAVCIKATVKYLSPDPTFDTEVWLKEAKENIDKGWETKVYDGKVLYPIYKPGGFDRQAASQGKLPDDTPPVTVITKKMIDKASAKIIEDRGVIVSRSEIIDMLVKNPDMLTE